LFLYTHYSYAAPQGVKMASRKPGRNLLFEVPQYEGNIRVLNGDTVRGLNYPTVFEAEVANQNTTSSSHVRLDKFRPALQYAIYYHL